MKTWNIGNTTVRNPERLAQALRLFAERMSGRPFQRTQQIEFQGHMIEAGLVDSKRVEGDDGARKFASCFKQLGLVTDWANGRPWSVTLVGQALLDHPQLEESLFLRQLVKYQIPSPLERGARVAGLRLRPFRVLLRFLVRARDAGLGGLTKAEIGLFVITTLTEDDAAFAAHWAALMAFRAEVDAARGPAARQQCEADQMKAIADQLGLAAGTLTDYADSSLRYVHMSGLLTAQGRRWALLDSRREFVDALLADGSDLVGEGEYLAGWLYDPTRPSLPSDDLVFLLSERRTLAAEVTDLSGAAGLPVPSPAPVPTTVLEAQAAVQALRDRRRALTEEAYAYDHAVGRPRTRLAEIGDLFRSLAAGGRDLVGGQAMRSAVLEWATWRLLLVIGGWAGPVEQTHNFRLDDSLNPMNCAPGGAADIVINYPHFTLVAEVTLTTGGRQFAAEGEPVTRHVARERQRHHFAWPVHGLFVAPSIDPNTADQFHRGVYRVGACYVETPVVALTLDDVLAVITRLDAATAGPADVRLLLEQAWAKRVTCQDGPAWLRVTGATLRQWLVELPARTESAAKVAGVPEAWPSPTAASTRVWSGLQRG